MTICKENLKKAVRLIGPDHTRLLVRFAGVQDSLEFRWRKRIKKYINKVDLYVADHLFKYGRLPADIDFSDLIMDHYFEVNKIAITTADEELEFLEPKEKRLASKPPAMKVPKTLGKLQETYDAFRKHRDMPKRQKAFAEKIKEAYIKKCQTVWQQFTDSFRAGEVFDKEEAVKVIKSASKGVASRTNTIVETETTNYYNNVRRDLYDKSNVVSHYLFLAIRDQATTKWCSDKVVDGKRGRHGLVYKKGDDLTDKETPAVHWNCRSEFVPLTPYNPRHKKLIEDDKLQRRNNTCHPLPKGWS